MPVPAIQCTHLGHFLSGHIPHAGQDFAEATYSLGAAPWFLDAEASMHAWVLQYAWHPESFNTFVLLGFLPFQFRIFSVFFYFTFICFLKHDQDLDFFHFYFLGPEELYNWRFGLHTLFILFGDSTSTSFGHSGAIDLIPRSKYVSYNSFKHFLFLL